jgi:putative mRNA 3-end processing factor
MIPWVSSRYASTVHATQITADIAELLFRDSLKIAASQGYPFPYGDAEVDIALDSFSPLNGAEATVGNLPLRFHSAGHIPGSIMVEVPSERTLYAFDINTVDTFLVRGAQPVSCDTLFIECTYAGNEHPDRRETEAAFLDEVEEVIRREGKAIIPAFAVGRTQELLMLLNERGFEVWVDGMGYKIMQIMLDYTQFLRYPKKLHRAFEDVNVVYSNRGKKLALQSGIVVTTSGMMNGGPVLWYINKVKDDPHSAVFVTGYQVEGTNGRMLLEHNTIDLYGVNAQVNCDVKFYDFSAHAGHSELVAFIKACRPQQVVIVHSDNPEAMADDLADVATVYMPSNGDTLVL